MTEPVAGDQFGQNVGRSVDDVRNRVVVEYGRPAPVDVQREPQTLVERVLAAVLRRRYYETRMMRPSVVYRDEHSISLYGERLVVVSEDQSSTEATARAIGEQLIRELRLPQFPKV